ncbi:MAG: homoserine dehydrogenase [Candidatus Pelagibacter sp. TMED118]|nr:MAG: homoserine dehydrogenase [Candidatus Pelagibacter sp. TMED118]
MKKKINIGIVGLGQIGNYLYNEIKKKKKDIELKTGKKINIIGVSAKNKNKKRKYKINKNIFFKNPIDLLRKKKVDILFECIGKSDGISKKTVMYALNNKINVITPNKALISKHGDYLSKIAEKSGINLEFEASVAGGIPIIRTIKDGLATNKINKVYGILNGTCNFILSDMEKNNVNFQSSLKKAQLLGFAEPGNPKLDLNGYDAYAKIKILSSLAFNTKIANKKSLMEGIENIELQDIKISKQLNYKIKLLAISEIKNGKLFERVHPCLIKKDSYLANVNGVMNAVITEGNPVGESVLQGEGAGPGPTSSALMSDLLSILRGNIKYPFGIPNIKRKEVKIFDYDNYINPLYLRFEVKDKPGVLAQITNQLAKKNISVERLIQIPNGRNKTASIVIITHKSIEINAQNCLKIISKNKNVLKYPTLIRLL